MTAYEKDMIKVQKLQQEIASLQSYVASVEREYDIATDQYMDGKIGAESIGRYQRSLTRERDKTLRQIERKVRQMNTICNKYRGF